MKERKISKWNPEFWSLKKKNGMINGNGEFLKESRWNGGRG